MANEHAGARYGAAMTVQASAREAVSLALPCLLLHLAFQTVWFGVAGTAFEDRIFAEDQFVEMATLAAFLVAGVYALSLAVRGRDLNGQDRLFVLGCGLLGLLGFLDEFSFGERIFGFEAVHVLGVKIDGAHDFFEVANNLRRETLGPMHFGAKVVFISGFVTLLAAAGWIVVVAARRARRFMRAGAGAAARWSSAPVVVCAVLFALELAISTLVDINVVVFEGAYAVEEVAELNAALLLLMMASSIAAGGVRRR